MFQRVHRLLLKYEVILWDGKVKYMTIKNLTPHTIVIVNEAGDVVREFTSEGLARVSSKEVITSMEDGIPISETTYGEVEGLPAEAEDTLLIVSRLVLSRCPDRKDLRVPGMQIRDAEGRVVGCKTLARN